MLVSLAARGEETAIIILTASVLGEDRRKIQESGAGDFLAKPCLENALLEKMGTLLNIAFDYEELDEGQRPTADVGGARH